MLTVTEKSLFVIYTPYQLLSSLNIVLEKSLKESCFVFVHPTMVKYLEYIKTINEIEVVDLSNAYDTKVNNSKNSHIHILKDFRRKCAVISSACKHWGSVNELFVPSDDIIARIIFKEIHKKNKNVIMNLFDDGTGTYIGTMHNRKRILSRVFFAIFLNTSYYERIEKVYCYQPDLYKHYHTGKKIVKIVKRDDVSRLFFPLVQEPICRYVGRKIVFLDQGIDEPVVQSCMDVISNLFSNEEIIIKKHPRIDSGIDYSGFEVSADGIPTELLFPLLNINNSLIFSVDSTGCIMPYLMDGITPHCILLFNMLESTDVYKKDKELVDYINKLIGYEYILTPNNVEEFKCILLDINNKLQAIAFD